MKLPQFNGLVGYVKSAAPRVLVFAATSAAALFIASPLLRKLVSYLPYVRDWAFGSQAIVSGVVMALAALTVAYFTGAGVLRNVMFATAGGFALSAITPWVAPVANQVVGFVGDKLPAGASA